MKLGDQLLRRNSLFIKIILLMVSGITIISIILTFASSSIAERILLKQVVQSATANMNLVKNDLLEYNDQVTNTMLQINSSEAFRNYITKPVETTLEHTNLVIALGKYIDTYKDYLSPEGSHILVSAMPGKGGRHYSSNALKWDKIPQDIVSDYMTEDGTILNRLQYFSSKDLFSDTVPYDNFIFATKPLIDGRTQLLYGYAAVVMDELNISSKYSPYLTEGIQIALISADGTILSSSKKEYISTVDNDLLATAEAAAAKANGTWSLEDAKTTYISFFLPEYNAYLIEEIDQIRAFSSLYSISADILKVVSVVVLISIIIVYFISKQMTKPLNQLVMTMQSSKGDSLIAHPLNESASYETNVLTKTYNRFIKEIESYTEQLVIEQQERRKADLNALQMQINPHFLYNTLSSIKYLAKLNRFNEVDQTINSLISMLQSTLGSTEDQVTLQSEIDTLKHYVFINQIRYGEKFNVHYEIAEKCIDLLVPKLILQPFVENAFFHAFPGYTSGNIHLFVRKGGDTLIIEVMDDGIGIADVDAAIHKHKEQHLSGIGISNVNSRIQLLYGTEYGVSIESEEGYGTVVKITLPLRLAV